MSIKQQIIDKRSQNIVGLKKKREGQLAKNSL